VPYTYVYLCHIHYIPLKEKKNIEPLNPELKNRPIKAAQQPPYLLPSSPLVPLPDALPASPLVLWEVGWLEALATSNAAMNSTAVL